MSSTSATARISQRRTGPVAGRARNARAADARARPRRRLGRGLPHDPPGRPARVRRQPAPPPADAHAAGEPGGRTVHESAESVRVALRAIGANKLRASLTMLGMIIGVGAVIALMSIGQGVQASVTVPDQGPGHQPPLHLPRIDHPERASAPRPAPPPR
ncbi:MAG: ABC transporter permease [Hymenobacter sp.]